MNISLAPIRLDEISKYVEIAFSDDEKLLGEYHIANGTLEHCVNHTVDFIKKVAETIKERMFFYSLVKDGEAIY